MAGRYTTANMPWDTFNHPAAPASVLRGWLLIGAAVRRRREGLRLSQRDLQRLSGTHQSVISRMERGRLAGMRWSRFAQLVDALDGLDFGQPTTNHWIALSHRREALAREAAAEAPRAEAPRAEAPRAQAP
jgi:transcriptional regulator with XRE-family HTH domain